MGGCGNGGSGGFCSVENGGGVQGVAMVVMVRARVVCSGWLMEADI